MAMGALYVSLYQSGEVVRLPLDSAGLPDEGGDAEAAASPIVRGAWPSTRAAVGSWSRASCRTPASSAWMLRPWHRSARRRSPRSPRGPAACWPIGQPRGLYSLAVRPRPADLMGTDGAEVWVGHLLLNVTTAQPDPTSRARCFPPSASRDSMAPPGPTLSTDSRLPGWTARLPTSSRARAPLPSPPTGAWRSRSAMSSEDVLVIDAESACKAGLVRPLPGDLPEGIVISPDGRTAYIDERASADIAVLRIAAPGESGPRTPRWRGHPAPRHPDPMPAELRLGQRLFYSANSSEFPMTKNFWAVCASCHLEGRSDAVTWRFAQGPRDAPATPAACATPGSSCAAPDATPCCGTTRPPAPSRRRHRSAPSPGSPYLDALAAPVDRAIPPTQSPERDLQTGALEPTRRARRGHLPAPGLSALPQRPRFTDSGSGNPTLDLTGTALLHDVGTCATGPLSRQAQPGLRHKPAPGLPV